MFNLFINICLIFPVSIFVGGLIGSFASVLLGALGFWLVGIITGVIFFAKFAMFDDHSAEPDARLSPDELYEKYRANHSSAYMFFLILYLGFKYGDNYKNPKIIQEYSEPSSSETLSHPRCRFNPASFLAGYWIGKR